MTTASSAAPLPGAAAPQRATRWRLLRNPSTLISLLLLAVMLLCAIVPDLLSPHDPYQQELSKRLLGPVFSANADPAHLLGTDQLGRDLLSRIIHGARITLLISVLAVLISSVLGTVVGLYAGYRGGWADLLLMRLIDMQLAFPVILLVIAVVALLGPSLVTLVAIIGLNLHWSQLARERTELRQRMESTFRQAFPKAQVVVDPLLQMQRQTADLRLRAGQTGPEDFLPLMTRFTQALGPRAADSLASLEYREGRLKARWRAGVLDSVNRENLRAACQRAGLRVQFEGDAQAVISVAG